MIRSIKAFLNGMREFRLSFTTHYTCFDQQIAYDLGREWAHRLTARRFDK